MLEPKRKAEQLVNKYFRDINLDWAIECALIAVDEILNMIDENDVDIWSFELLVYWKEVKQEIENLK